MANVLTPDLCVIGAGAGGRTVAAGAAALGRTVALVEQGKMGGESLNNGCVPSKALLAAARRFSRLSTLARYGISTEGAAIDFHKVRMHMKEVVAAIEPNDSRERFSGLGVQVIAGTARFTDRETVAVGDDTAIKARRFVIATGSSPAYPLMPGLDTVGYLTNETIFDVEPMPTHLIVVGGGPVGIELAQAFRRCGAAVTVLEARRPLGDDDPECVDTVLAALAQDGVVVRSGATVRQVAKNPAAQDSGAQVQVTFETEAGTETVSGSHILLAVGRRPNVDSLDLKAAGVKYDANGIIVDRKLQTSNKRIFAVGDVAGGPRFTHAASYHADIVIRNALLHLRAKVDPKIIPRVTFTDPELAHVGMTEDDARKARRKFRVLRSTYFDNDRAQCERDTRGHIKALTDNRGTILGVTIVGENAGELIATWTLAIANDLNIRSMAELVAPYPTNGEIGKRAAMTYFSPSLARPMVRRIVSFLRRFG
jgi:pyruvate/2-oxoglutarate dehydrogenase complex dihydrolipoamide dehydrogenase (E3) component